MSLSGIVSQFPEAASRLPGRDSSKRLRSEALARFEALGLPGRRIEAWHYTDLASLAERNLEFASAAPAAELIAAASARLAALGLDPDAPLCVFLDGHLLESLCSMRHDSITMRSLQDADTDLLHEETDAPALVALNTAFAGAGALIQVAQPVDRPIQLVFFSAAPNLAQQLRLRLEIAPAASATLIQYFPDLRETGESWLNLVTDIDMGEASALALYRLQRCNEDRVQTSLTRARLAARAKFSAACIETGGSLVRNEIELDLAGEEAEASILGLALTRNRTHCDTRIAIDHRAPRTRSRQNFRCVAADRSRSIFSGKVTVREDAQHIDAQQRNDNLLLSATAEADSRPELEIYADQVACSHGATVGELDEDHLFYLQSRGIDAVAARSILTTAFADVILNQLAHEGFRSEARAAAAQSLPQYIDQG